MKPYILEVSATATVTTVLYAENDEAAEELLEANEQQLTEALWQKAQLPVNAYVLVDSFVASAPHVTVDPQYDEYIQPGSFQFEKCDHCTGEE